MYIFLRMYFHILYFVFMLLDLLYLLYLTYYVYCCEPIYHLLVKKPDSDTTIYPKSQTPRHHVWPLHFLFSPCISA